MAHKWLTLAALLRRRAGRRDQPTHSSIVPGSEDGVPGPLPALARVATRGQRRPERDRVWNRANSIIFYGKNAELASNRRDEQEMSVLCLRICQAAMVYVNVLMIQDVLADPDWVGVLTAEDERGLTPLFWSHVLPYGEVKLNMNTRLALSEIPPSG
ncbi:Tn3 family transposase [Rhodococcus sp. NPDC056960]|uniref:Tn3 family transposase n=1 Tax=Rhodococcus sp. NPDC056960 TaxID=3345982 RepID=UPI003632074F